MAKPESRRGKRRSTNQKQLQEVFRRMVESSQTFKAAAQRLLAEEHPGMPGVQTKRLLALAQQLKRDRRSARGGKRLSKRRGKRLTKRVSPRVRAASKSPSSVRLQDGHPELGSSLGPSDLPVELATAEGVRVTSAGHRKRKVKDATTSVRTTKVLDPTYVDLGVAAVSDADEVSSAARRISRRHRRLSSRKKK